MVGSGDRRQVVMAGCDLAILLSFLCGLLLASGASAESCSDFSAYTRSCPPAAGTCSLGPNPDSCAQDCSTCTPAVDDDGDCVADEEIINNADDDGDGLIDEDVACINDCPLGPTCPFDQVDGFGSPLPPIDSLIRLPAAVSAWSCGGPGNRLDLDLELEPYPDELNNPECGHNLVLLRVLQGTDVYFEGPASLVFTRRWESLESSLVPGATGSVEVFRYTVRADFTRVAPYSALPAALQVPCSENATARPHTFFYGLLDLARDLTEPDNRSRYRYALTLGHSPGGMTHPEGGLFPGFPPRYLCDPVNNDTTARPITAGLPERHESRGWFLVAPSTNFSFSSSAAVPTGIFEFGRIRQVPNQNQPCPRSTKMCESQFLDAPNPGAVCTSNITYRQERFCGIENSPGCPHFNIASDTKCDTIRNDRVAFFPVGSWSQTEYPADQSISLFEGGMVCLANFEPYWYGAYTNMAPTGPFWRAPEHALDVIENQVMPNSQGFGAFLIGGVNWFQEGTPMERFIPLQFRTMYFFPSINPDIPMLAACQADAIIEPVARPWPCEGDPLTLSGARSFTVNCCSCGELEFQWSHLVGATWVIDQPWTSSTSPIALDITVPGACVDYKLEVRCNNSKTACVDEEIVQVCPGCLCGNSTTDPGEECDDGNADPADLCHADCTLTYCGDNVTQSPNGRGTGGSTNRGDEECDDGNAIPGDGCTDCIRDCVQADIQPIELLRAIKSGSLSDVVMSFQADIAADGYNAWFVLVKRDIPLAREGGGGTFVPGCHPSPAQSCTHVGAVPVVPVGPLLYYQIRGSCLGTEARE